MQWSQQLEEISCMCIHSVLTVSWGFTEYCASPLEAEGAKICNQTLLFISVSPAWQVSLVAHKVKNLPTNAGDAGSIPQLGRSPGEVFLPGKSRGQEPGGLQSKGSQELDTT